MKFNHYVRQRWGISRGTGGLPGLDVHVGAWMALAELVGGRPDCVTGASAGAVVSALQATGWTPNSACAEIRGMRSESLIRHRFAWRTRALLTDMDAILDPQPVAGKLNHLLPLSWPEEVGLLISATRMDRGGATAAMFRSGTAAALTDAVQASASIPGFWPYVRIGDAYYSDGGCTDPVPVPADVADYDLWVHVEPIRDCDYQERDRNVVSRLLWAVESLGRSAVEARRGHLEHVLGDRLVWIEVPLGEASALDFDHRLIMAAYVLTLQALHARGW